MRTWLADEQFVCTYILSEASIFFFCIVDFLLIYYDLLHIAWLIFDAPSKKIRGVSYKWRKVSPSSSTMPKYLTADFQGIRLSLNTSCWGLRRNEKGVPELFEGFITIFHILHQSEISFRRHRRSASVM